MTIKAIKSEQDYQEAMKTVEALWSSPEGSSEADYLEVLAILIEDYEKKHFSLPDLDPIDLVKYQMEELGLSKSDVAPFFGGTNRVSEVLSGKRNLTLKMIREISRNLNIPPNLLIGT
ncbi:helix-turn-helix domain-containing protein [Tellurirhabdus rosea]|uniref:helix-turn-helix domain-containing protein n=1 Tax=Tellurirhabdus rosea TaxID=2674997 RepID=UPI002254B84E|nr:helix-turn-helix domain-containing protein [Tellurirhabdus rosea]